MTSSEVHGHKLSTINNAISRLKSPTMNESQQTLMKSPRHPVNARVQAEGETAAVYLTSLRLLADKCNFGDNLKNRLLVKFVNGLNSVNLKKKLWEKSDLTLEDAIKCTRLHNPNYCPARYWKCFNCGIQGHTSTACNQAKAVLEESTDEEIEEIIVGRISNAHLPIIKSTSDLQVRNIPSAQLTLAPTSSESQSNLYVYRVTNNPLLGNIVINDKSVECEFDSGSAVSLMSLSKFSDKFPESKEEKCTSRLWNVDGQPLNTIGEIKVTVFVQPNRYTIRLIVVKFAKPTKMLVGREWLDTISPNWRHNLLGSLLNDKAISQNCSNISVKHTQEKHIDGIKLRFPHACSTDKSTSIRGYKAQLVLKDDVRPIFHKFYEIPFSQSEEVHQIIMNLVKSQRLEPVTHSEWASPIWPVKKKTGGIRVVVDFRKIVNPCLRLDHYPLPRLEDIWSKLANCNFFTKIDLTEAYLQLKVTDDSKEILTINTPWGLFQFNRLIYGINSGSSIFQSIIDRILSNLPWCGVFIDDIVFGDKTID
nr:PREDICTED: uncharacterized protein K02A2.6-like [Bemisia tabaci]